MRKNCSRNVTNGQCIFGPEKEFGNVCENYNKRMA